MKQALIKTALAACVTLTMLSTPSAATIDDYRWQKRLLIVFAADTSSEKLAQQRTLIAQEKTQFADRDLIPIEVIGNTVQGTSETADTLRRRYKTPADTFRVLLIGKDGGIRIQSEQPVTPKELFGTIDAMPMRQQEMQRPPRS